jgi:hypothetical protein
MNPDDSRTPAEENSQTTIPRRRRSYNKWSRNQKLGVIGLIITGFGAVGGWVGKVEIRMNYIQEEVKNLVAKVATIKKLEAGDVFVTGAINVNNTNTNIGSTCWYWFLETNKLGRVMLDRRG